MYTERMDITTDGRAIDAFAGLTEAQLEKLSDMEDGPGEDIEEMHAEDGPYAEPE